MSPWQHTWSTGGHKLYVNKLESVPTGGSRMGKWLGRCQAEGLRHWDKSNPRRSTDRPVSEGLTVKGWFHLFCHSLDSRTQTNGEKLPEDTFQLSRKNFLTMQTSNNNASVHQWNGLSCEGGPESTIWHRGAERWGGWPRQLSGPSQLWNSISWEAHDCFNRSCLVLASHSYKACPPLCYKTWGHHNRIEAKDILFTLILAIVTTADERPNIRI